MLNLDSRSRSKLVWVATLLTPVVAVQGVRLFTGSSASSASAAVAPTPDAAPTALPGEIEKALSPAQAKAVEWLNTRSAPLARRSPMDRPDQAPEPEPVPDVRPDPTPVHDTIKPTDDAPSGLVLTGMIAGGPDGAALCAINHRIYRVGQEVSPAWRVSRIDARRRVVVLEGPDARTAVLSPPTPAIER